MALIFTVISIITNIADTSSSTSLVPKTEVTMKVQRSIYGVFMVYYKQSLGKGMCSYNHLPCATQVH